jgi:hypothetical protein
VFEFVGQWRGLPWLGLALVWSATALGQAPRARYGGSTPTLSGGYGPTSASGVSLLNDPGLNPFLNPQMTAVPYDKKMMLYYGLQARQSMHDQAERRKQLARESEIPREADGSTTGPAGLAAYYFGRATPLRRGYQSGPYYERDSRHFPRNTYLR